MQKFKKILTDPSSYALILLAFYGLVIYPGCFLNVKGTAIEDPAVPPQDGCAGQYYSYDLHSYFHIPDYWPNARFHLAEGDSLLSGHAVSVLHTNHQM